MNPDFVKLIEAEGSPVFEGLLPALKQQPAVSIKINQLKTSPEKIREHFPVDGIVPWEPNAFYLAERPAFTLDPLLHQGHYYVQEASSMIHAAIIRRLALATSGRPLRLLDCCAAPGGKTTSLLMAAPEGSAVIANEFDFKRAEILKENLFKWGSPNVAVTRGDTSRFRKAGAVFDVVVADMPCSGEGMFRKDAEARNQWSEGLVEHCAGLQREIAANVLPSLAADGFFVYSTCTFNTVENEGNIKWLCEEFGLETVDMHWPVEWGVQGAVNSDMAVSRFLPSKLRGEGLFVAVLQKNTGDRLRTLKETHPQKKHTLSPWVSEALDFYERQGEVWATTPLTAAMACHLEKKGIDFISIGTPVATLKGKDVIPQHSLALSVALNRHVFPEVAVDRENAVAFLRRDNMSLTADAPKGYVLLTYEGCPLGFVKNLGNRLNNLYPKEWRIRH